MEQIEPHATEEERIETARRVCQNAIKESQERISVALSEIAVERSSVEQEKQDVEQRAGNELVIVYENTRINYYCTVDTETKGLYPNC